MDRQIHALIGPLHAVERGVHLLLRKALAPHRQHEFFAQRLRLRKRHELVLAHGGEARQEGEVEGRHPNGRRRHLVDEAHQRSHLRPLDTSAFTRVFRRAMRARRKALRLGRDLVEILDDDGRIDDDIAVVVERRHHAVGIELKIIGLELIAGEEIELLLLEGEPLGIEHEAHPLAAGRLRRVVEREGHLSAA